MSEMHTLENAIAIIGMSGRFPGSRTLEEFWQHLRDGDELITFFSDQELLDAGVDPALVNSPQYVKGAATIEDYDRFDATLFGYSPREAEVLDPQQRLFLLCAHEALEHAGYLSDSYRGRIGVFAGMGLNTYLTNNLMANRDFMATANRFQMLISNDKDFLPTRVSYKLDLRGPSFGVQTACSTSLVAVHVACQNLLYGECDLALTGAVSVGFPHTSGYVYHEGEVLSPDGHCRTFDARAQGTVPSHGLGVVVLKRLAEAIEDSDTIYAVIRGSAINNDGAAKVGYTAPSVDGQAEVIAEALTIADVPVESISYVEAHGTATPLGDPIEMAALIQVYQANTDKKHFCAIGSLKSNLGHLDAAAGMGGLIKTVLALTHEQLPPSLHFEQPNPKIDFANSPFYVITQLADWKCGSQPRRAGISSFGIGGTNAHLILEEAPLRTPSGPSRPWQVLVLSAKMATALESATTNLLQFLKQYRDNPNLSLADVAYTLQVGRRHYGHRRTLVCRSVSDAIQILEQRDGERISTQYQEQNKRRVAFLFPGQGTQYVQMGRELYETEPTFREHVDTCSQLLLSHLGLDLRSILYPAKEWEEEAARQLNQTYLTQPALFVIEYALSQLWRSWGLQPSAFIGHSIGEYVAACLAGVLSLADALFLVAKRGRLMQETLPGAMLSVPLPAAQILPCLHGQLSLAAINAPALCTVSGPTEEIDELQHLLLDQGIETRLLQTSHAFHSPLMEPILTAFERLVQRVKLQPPTMPYISNLSGREITAAEATDPRYWVDHLRQPVLFADGLRELLQQPDLVFLEVGPGRTLSTLVRQCQAQGAQGAHQLVFSTLRHPQDLQPDGAFLLATLGRLWLAGVQIDWPAFSQHEQRQRIPLPTYPFELRRYWVEPQSSPAFTPATIQGGRQSLDGQEQGQDQQAEPANVPQPQGNTLVLYERPGLQNEYVAPETLIEQHLAEIWQESLGIQQVGIHDNFFELGGHSLLATQLISRIQAAFPVEVPLRTIFEAPTVARLSEIIEDKLIEKLEEMEQVEAMER